MATKTKPEDWLEEGSTNYLRLTGWLRDGLANEQIFENMGVSKATFYRWISENKTFKTLIKTFREAEIRNVENSLYEQCKKGNTAAIIFYLKNKHPNVWKDRVEQQMDNSALETLNGILDSLKDSANNE